jgi:peptidoglycan hydrolase-like protein with peptidoglycan-binding domain
MGGLGVVVLAAGAAAVALKAGVAAPSAKMHTDPDALTRVSVSGPGAQLDSVRAVGPDGRTIPVSVRDGRVWPKVSLPVGEKVVVTATITRSAPVSWVLGHTFHLQRAFRTPKARIASRWLEIPAGGAVKLSFAAPVARVSIRSGTHDALHSLPHGSRSLTLAGSVPAASARTVQVAAAPRTWETLPEHVPVTWFAAGGLPKVVATPRPGAAGLGPGAVLRLTFSRPVSEIFGERLPRLSPHTPGRWHQVDTHTLAFAPTGAGFGIDAKIKVALPRAVQLAGRPKGTTTLTWSAASGSILRLQQLLANLGYLPVQWAPSGDPVAGTVAAQQAAAIDPPAGHFGWIWDDVPATLRSEWRPGQITPMTQGAVMAFQAQHGLKVDGFAGPIVWHDLIAATLSGTRNTQGYSYVLVRKSTPQSLTLWHDDAVLVSGPSNTGIPKAPTPDGTFPVYLRLRSQTMSGTNPDGTHYSDAGIKWISYFHAGEAIHGFDRTSYGSPQSLGCVELPVSEAARVWPYTPIGTLVTIAP